MMSRICSRDSSSAAKKVEGHKGEGMLVCEKRDSLCPGGFGRWKMLFQAEGLSKGGTCGVNNVM